MSMTPVRGGGQFSYYSSNCTQITFETDEWNGIDVIGTLNISTLKFSIIVTFRTEIVRQFSSTLRRFPPPVFF